MPLLYGPLQEQLLCLLVRQDSLIYICGNDGRLTRRGLVQACLCGPVS